MLVKKDRDNYWILNWLDEFMIGHKGFIVGGCFKNIINGEKVKDLDIFFKSLIDWEHAVQYYDELCGEDNEGGIYRFYYENDNVKAYKHVRTGITIELCRKIFGTAEEILNSFDFTIVKFAYYKEEVTDEPHPFDDEEIDTHIEYKIICHDQFFKHLHTKRLVIDDKIPFPMSTFERMFRYAKYGYFPCRETKMKIIQALHEVPSEQIELSSSMYDGMD
ncbi:MAG TPA: hypothetical protein VN258_06460 [Mobilitalea sp.]|nr:hypothetical protein [Mobilitalea sp.]